MPFRKRNVRRVRRRFKPRSSGAKALHMVRKLKSVLAVEKKNHTLTVSGTIPTTGTIDHLTAIAQGDTNQLRDGNQLKVIYLGGRIRLLINASQTRTFVRVMLVQDRQQIADATPAVGDILQSVSPTSFLNSNTLGRFKVLYDKVRHMSDNGNQLIYLKVDIPMNSKIRYNGTGVGDIQKNGIFLILIADNATDLPSINSSWRVRFTDN